MPEILFLVSPLDSTGIVDEVCHIDDRTIIVQFSERAWDNTNVALFG